MKNETLREREILKLKKELVEKYVYIMCSIFFCYTFCFIFYIKSNFMLFYILGGVVSLGLGWFMLKDRIPVEKLMHAYLIIAPLYCSIVILFFWNLTVTNFVWLLSVPIGAYIFFSSKKVLVYSLYTLSIIVIISIVANNITLHAIQIPNYKIRISDIFLFIVNILIATHLLSYKDKIRSLQIITRLEKQEKIELPVSLDKKDIVQYKKIFDNIEQLVVGNQVFKDPNFNISTLSTMLKVSNSYISRSIRYQNYPNFNSYLNFHRIEYVINLIHTKDLAKVTMLYIWSEAGYKSQSTFNRAFKELKGVTPSEYIQSIKKTEVNDTFFINNNISFL